jgi:hypothetical protein
MFLNSNTSCSMYFFCNSRIHVITLYSGHVCVYYASMLRCWYLIWILVRTDHPCLGVRWILLLLRKGAPDSTPQPGWVARGTHINFSPKTAIEAVGLSQAHVDSRLLGLPRSYHRHAIGTFNTCTWVPTSRSLNDTGGGYHIENLRIATMLSPLFPSEGSIDPPKWPRPIFIFIQH